MRRLVALALATLVVGTTPAAAGRPPEPRCSAAEARGIVHHFVEAYNRGDVDYLDQLWAQEPEFFWYFDNADPARRSPLLSEDRKTLTSYFTQRALLGDQLHLRKLSARWQRGWHAAWGISFELHRVSDQPEAEGIFHGKGAVTCGRRGSLLHAWAMGAAS